MTETKWWDVEASDLGSTCFCMAGIREDPGSFMARSGEVGLTPHVPASSPTSTSHPLASAC